MDANIIIGESPFKNKCQQILQKINTFIIYSLFDGTVGLNYIQYVCRFCIGFMY